VGLVKELNHLTIPFVCELIGLFTDGNHFYIVQELGTEGDLFKWSSTLPRPVSEREEQIRPVVVQVCAAMRQLHDLGLAHRNVSLENILVTRGSQNGALSIKVIDFGMSCLSQFGKGSRYGKYPCRAPEMHMEAEYDLFLADNFAIGCVVYSMLWRRYPWQTTVLGKDRHFDYAWTHGVHRFLALKPRSEDEQIGTMSPLLVEVLCRLLHMQARCRASLGETCFRHERDRTCISHMEWMSQKEARLLT